METATIDEKFHHAVEIIQHLPENGSFQPSNDLKLKFYSYFKQATKGPCNISKPGFWDIVGKLKWDAWNRLGDMPRDEAMHHYVDTFIEVIKTQPYDESAADYVHLMGPFIELVPKELKDNHFNNNMDFHVDSNTPQTSSYKQEDLNGGYQNGTAESDCEEFSDVNEELSESDRPDNVEPNYLKASKYTEARGGGEKRFGTRNDVNTPILGASASSSNIHPSSQDINIPAHSSAGGTIRSGGSGREKDGESDMKKYNSDVNEQLTLAVFRLQHTMDQVVNRLDSLEILLQNKEATIASRVRNHFTHLFGIPMHTMFLILLWPFCAKLIMHIIRRRHFKHIIARM